MSTLLGMKKLFVVVLQLHVLEFFFVHLPSSLPYSESKYVKIRNVYDYVQISVATSNEFWTNTNTE